MASEPGKSRPVKGILKHTSSLDKAGKTEVLWDEMNILATHHPPDKDYGHMKIDEPPTPYNKYSEGEESEGESSERRGSASNLAHAGLDPSQLASRLENAESRSRKLSASQDDSDDEKYANETEEERKHRKQFEMKRKLHYNEFAAVQLAKKLMSEEDEEDEDDDGGKKSDASASTSTGPAPKSPKKEVDDNDDTAMSDDRP